LDRLYCDNNQFVKLNLSERWALRILWCSNSSQLTELNLKGCTALNEVWCNDNHQLTELNIMGCTDLMKLECDNNQLTELDLSWCRALLSLKCRNNRLTAAKLNVLFGSLPEKDNADYSVFIRGNPGVATCNRKIATKKNWKVVDYE